MLLCGQGEILVADELKVLKKPTLNRVINLDYPGGQGCNHKGLYKQKRGV